MRSYESLFEKMADTPLQGWLDILPSQIESSLNEKRHGKLAEWRQVIAELPGVQAGRLDFDAAAVSSGLDVPLGDDEKEHATALLKRLMPWRKGPYSLHGIYIDTEWRSDWKWDRIRNRIQPLDGRRVLDAGCGNGYHGWRMLGAGAELVIGVDPSILFVMQWEAVKHFTGDCPMYVLPLGIQAVPSGLRAFDTVFSMGVLYHRRSPIDHIIQLKECLRPGGELVLETLVIEGDENQILLPQDRYAKMRNVWFIPSYNAMVLWLQRCGFKKVEVVDVSQTTTDEQRGTEWMLNESLEDFLYPDDPNRTVEGYPAPRRAVFTAESP